MNEFKEHSYDLCYLIPSAGCLRVWSEMILSNTCVLAAAPETTRFILQPVVGKHSGDSFTGPRAGVVASFRLDMHG